MEFRGQRGAFFGDIQKKELAVRQLFFQRNRYF
jgi:hypothetical protein